MPCIPIDTFGQRLKWFTQGCFGVCLILLSLFAQTVYADDAFNFRTLLMPGELIAGHAKYESQCQRCHASENEVAQPRLCLDCHEKVDADIRAQSGFHGRLPDASGATEIDCSSCHTDHIGREADIVSLDTDRFDHQLTDFPLLGRHQGLACQSCHEAGQLHSEAPGECIDCHKGDDRHQGALGQVCQDCHEEKDWRSTRFDHSNTDFSLNGAHRKVQCSACHAGEHYANTPKACVTCHAINDVHAGNNGDECDQCHQESRWTRVNFDHDKDTDFALKGAHKSLVCKACHQDSAYENPLEQTCIACHQTDDEHNGRFGKRCDSCHTEQRWKQTHFDHSRDTDFKLLGAHDGLSCVRCHQAGTNQSVLGAACDDCHRKDDVHEGQQGSQCEACHSNQNWFDSVRFNHDLTSFPLVGLHGVTSCESCHLSKTFSDAQPQCVSCHRDDDPHKQALGTQCGDCHTPKDWAFWVFDHNDQTDFILDGAHEGLRCESCHTEAAGEQVQQSATCGVCHAQDDVHNRRFGRVCERCHTTNSFKEIRVK